MPFGPVHFPSICHVLATFQCNSIIYHVWHPSTKQAPDSHTYNAKLIAQEWISSLFHKVNKLHGEGISIYQPDTDVQIRGIRIHSYSEITGIRKLGHCCLRGMPRGNLPAPADRASTLTIYGLVNRRKLTIKT